MYSDLKKKSKAQLYFCMWNLIIDKTLDEHNMDFKVVHRTLKLEEKNEI